jgi:hypothetical protein
MENLMECQFNGLSPIAFPPFELLYLEWVTLQSSLHFHHHTHPPYNSSMPCSATRSKSEERKDGLIAVYEQDQALPTLLCALDLLLPELPHAHPAAWIANAAAASALSP